MVNNDEEWGKYLEFLAERATPILTDEACEQINREFNLLYQAFQKTSDTIHNNFERINEPKTEIWL